MQESDQMLKIKYPNKVEGKLKVIGFKDGDFEMAYCAALNLSGYGATTNEAIDMLVNVVIRDWCENLMKLPEYAVHAELKRLGWSKSTLLRKKFTASPYVDREGILREFNLDAETKLTERLIAV